MPQLDTPKEIPVEHVDVTTFRMPGAAAPGVIEVTEISGVKPYQQTEALCVLNTADMLKTE